MEPLETLILLVMSINTDLILGTVPSYPGQVTFGAPTLRTGGQFNAPQPKLKGHVHVFPLDSDSTITYSPTYSFPRDCNPDLLAPILSALY